MSIGKRVLFLEQSAISYLTTLSDNPTEDAAFSFIAYLTLLSRDINTAELNAYMQLAGITFESVLPLLAKAVANGLINFAGKSRFIDAVYEHEDFKVDDEWQRYAKQVEAWRKSYFSVTPMEVKEMKLLRAQCESCGIFDIKDPEGSEVFYVKFSREPRCKIECPECGELVISPISLSTAMMLESVGIKASHWSTQELTEESIEKFVENIDAEITLLLDG